jgi:hypothetical protein
MTLAIVFGIGCIIMGTIAIKDIIEILKNF